MKRALLIILILCCIAAVYGQGSVSGNSTLCQGGSAQYTVSGSSATSGYTWTVAPLGAGTVTTGQGSKTVTVSFTSPGTNSVYVSGNGLYTYINVTVTPTAGTPSAISGSSVVCPGSSTTFTSSATPSTSLTWYVVNGNGITVTPQTGNSPTVSIPSNTSLTSFQINVFAVNGICGAGPTTSKTVTISTSGGQLPSAPASVSGTAQVCLGAQGIVYTVPIITDATGYVWSVPAGATIASGQNTTSIIANYSSSSVIGNVSVYGTNCNGSGTSTSLTITGKPVPNAALAITGTASVCASVQNVAYSVAAITGATGYVWSVPAGATISSGQNTNSIRVNYPSSAVNGNVSVYGTNCTGNGASASFVVTTSPVPGAAGAILGNMEVCNSGGRVTYSVSPIANATSYTWTPPSGGGGIISGQGTNSIDVYFTDVNPGLITVAGTNCGINGPSSSLSISFIKPETGGPNINYGVDNVTGRLNASLPLASVQSGDVQIPVILSYSAEGVRVTDNDGWLGQGWSLSVQSLGIFREMRSLPDDYSATGTDTRKGWLFGTARTTIKNFTPTTDNNTATCSDEVANFNTLNTLDYTQDTEPDAFHVSVPGLSFDFYFDEDRLIHVAPLQDVVITPYTAAGVFNPAATGGTTAGPITYFTVIDSKGVTYEFRENETLTEKMKAVNQNYFVRRSNLHAQSFMFTTAWRLTKISSPVYGEVNLTYNTVSVPNSDLILNPYTSGKNFKPKYIYQYPLVTVTPYFSIINDLSYSRDPVFKVLKQISSSTTVLDFTSYGVLLQSLGLITVSDKREGQTKRVRTIEFDYDNTNNHAFLDFVEITTVGCSAATYGFLYNNSPSLPDFSSSDKDEWGFYKVKDNSYAYDETAVAGSLQRINQPNKGYAAFFYETHDFLKDGVKVQGGGIRTRKIISYDGVSTGNNTVQEFEYKTTDGQTSGKLQSATSLSFSVTRLFMQTNQYSTANVWYYEKDPSTYSYNGGMFTLTASEDLATPSLLNGSVVAYERVTVKTKDAGHTVYEYDLPASAGDVTVSNGDWAPSKVLIARPATGYSDCYATPDIAEGYNRFPFPANPNYDFARGLLKKQTDYNESDIKVRDVVSTYQRQYSPGASMIRKIYGLSLEELPTYRGTGGSPFSKMFLYSKYEIFTDVKTAMATQTETIYNSSDLAQNTQIITSYFYTGTTHRELTRVEKQNSDGSFSNSKLTYSKDFNMATPSGTPAIAIAALNTNHRNELVESLSTKVINGTEKYMGGSLTLYQTIGGKVYPDKSYSFTASDGITTFTPSSISGGVFQYDVSNYILGKSYISFDDYGNVSATVDRSKNMGGVAYGYLGTLPILQVSNAGINEVTYSDFETTAKNNFTVSGYAPTYATGRTGATSKGLILPAGSFATKMLAMGAVTNNKSQTYILSCWIKAATAGSLSFQVYNTVTSTGTTFSNAYTVSADYKYYRFTIPVSTVIGTNPIFTGFLWSNKDIQIDDIAFYPAHADIVTSTYTIPNGKTSDTDSRGYSFFYENDLWGRPLLVYDRNRNIIKKYNYQSR